MTYFEDTLMEDKTLYVPGRNLLVFEKQPGLFSKILRHSLMRRKHKLTFCNHGN